MGASEGCQGPCSSEPRERSGLQAHFPAEMTEARDEGSAWGGNESRAGDIGLLVAQQSGARVALEPAQGLSWSNEGDSGPTHKGLEYGGQGQALLGTLLSPSPDGLPLDLGLNLDGFSFCKKPA